jgi:beta-xylosidase
VTLRIAGVAPNAVVSMQQVDEDHGNTMKTYTGMGSPRYPTRTQVQQMNAASALPAPDHLTLHDNILKLDLKPNELVLLHVDGGTATHSRPSSTHPQE